MWQSSFITLVVVFAIYGFFHSFLASLPVKSWAQKTFPANYRYYRLCYSLFAGISLIPILYLILYLPDILLYKFKPPVLIITLLLQFFAVWLLWRGGQSTDTKTNPGFKLSLLKDPTPEKLTTTGLYRHVRHPIYSISLVIIWLFPYVTSKT